MKNVADRVRYIRKRIGASQEELAIILGCSEGKIKGWEQGRTKTIKLKDARILSEKYGFSTEWIEDGVGQIMIDEGELLLKQISSVNNLLNNNNNIPYYKDINASAGYGCTNEECNPSFITLENNMLPTDSKNIEAIKVDGNSMIPTIDDEDIIFINKNDEYLVDGKIYVVYLCEEVYVKRIFIEPKTKEIILKSDNPIYPQIKADCEDFKIIGRVIANMKINKL